MFLNKEQQLVLLQTYYHYKFDISTLFREYQSKICKQELKKYLANKIKSIVLQLQSELCSSGSISEMKFYDFETTQLFSQMIYLDRILSSQSAHNLILLERYKTFQLQKLPSEIKLKIYSQFKKYGERMNLFNYAILGKGQMKKGTGFQQNPQDIFSAPQLQLIFTIYKICNANYNFIAQELRKRGYFDEQFQGKELEKKLKNLQLIGLFRCYKKSVKSKGGKGMDWQSFIGDYMEIKYKISSWDSYLMKILMKMAVRNNAFTKQIRNICSKLGRSYHDDSQPKKVKKRRIPEDKDIPVEEQKMIMEDFTKQLINILKTKKQIKMM